MATNATSNLIKATTYAFKGGKLYWGWIAGLLAVIALGVLYYFKQATDGMIWTNMRDQVSWGFYIANFTFLVGVAAAAVLLVIPAYIYNFKPIKEIVLFSEILAVAAIIMCLLFVSADLGRVERAWHILPPPIGKMHFPVSILAWDVLVLNGYLLINLLAVGYVLYSNAKGEQYKMSFMWPIIIISIPWAFSIHTVTAFLYAGLPSRPFWNAAVLAPRFIASALCSGPALMLIIFQIIRKVSTIEITNRAIFKIAELMAYTMAVNLYLFCTEIFKEFYSDTLHVESAQYLYFGLHGHAHLAGFAWTALIFNVVAFILLLVPRTRQHFFYLNLACGMIFIAVYLEKGMGLVVPGFIPGTLGEIYPYLPSVLEQAVSFAIWAFGALVFTILVKITIPLYTGEITGIGHNK
jgi:Ni/Fe-hydrogenase subunit HybB-like protein